MWGRKLQLVSIGWRCDNVGINVLGTAVIAIYLLCMTTEGRGWTTEDYCWLWNGGIVAATPFIAHLHYWLIPNAINFVSKNLTIQPGGLALYLQQTDGLACADVNTLPGNTKPPALDDRVQYSYILLQPVVTALSIEPTTPPLPAKGTVVVQRPCFGIHIL